MFHVFVLHLTLKFRNAKSDSAIRMHSGFISPRTEKSRSTSAVVMLSEDPSTPTTDIEVIDLEIYLLFAFNYLLCSVAGPRY